MLNKRLKIGRSVQSDLIDAEQKTGEALAAISKLTITVVKSRSEANLSHTIGAMALSFTGNASKMLHDAQEQLAQAHGAFAKDRDNMGLRTHMSGGGWKPPSAQIAEPANEEQIKTA